jgi:N-acetyl-anhydromuramyl-L-alanine amidase AmpD
VKVAEYPGALWMPAHPTNYYAAGRSSYRHVVIHCTDGHGIAKATAAMWQMPHHGSSAHFVVGQLGEVVQSVGVEAAAYHAHSANRSSVGIEHCCRTPGELGPSDPGLRPSPVLLAASAKLVAWLCQRGGLPITREVIRGHAEIDPMTTHSGCPTSAGIDLDAIVALARVAAGA